MPAQDQSKGSRFGMGAAVLLLMIGAVAMGFQLLGGRESGAGPVAKTAFYTDDNGVGFFKDDVNKPSPFDHGGKQAYRCDVFEGPGGKQFVGLIYRYTDSGWKEMQAYWEELARRTPIQGRSPPSA